MKKQSTVIRLAKTLGVSAAVVYERVYDLCSEKARRDADYHDGFFWVRMPCKDFRKIFPYMSEGTVYKAIRKLRDEGLIMVAHYDEHNSIVNWFTTIENTSACRPENVLY